MRERRTRTQNGRLNFTDPDIFGLLAQALELSVIDVRGVADRESLPSCAAHASVGHRSQKNAIEAHPHKNTSTSTPHPTPNARASSASGLYWR